MKNIPKIIYSTFLMCAIIIILLNSCSIEENLPKSESVILKTDSIQYAPYEFVTITSSENIYTTKSFTAKINDIVINVGSNENTASFVLPNLINGTYNLNFTLNDKKYIVPITVSSLTDILSADQYFNEIQTSTNQNIDDLNSQITQMEQNSTNPNEYTALKNDVIKYTNLLNDYATSYNNLSTLEKQEFAKSMAANETYIDDYNRLLAKVSF